MRAASTMLGCMRWLALLAALGALAVASTTAHADGVVVNQASATDPAGDSSGGPDLSGLTVTSYSDGTVSFAVQFANRNFLQPGETVQIFLDVNDDGKADLNLSVWQNFEPSYLARWTGSDWSDIRQLPELVQTQGAVSERISLNELQSAAAVPVAPAIQVAAATYVEDAKGTVPVDTADDWIPSATSWFAFPLKPGPQTGTTGTTGTTGATSAGSGESTAPTGPKIPVSVQVDAPGLVHAGEDAKLRILLQSRSGPMRLFKVCAQATGVPHPNQCRSTHSTGKTPVPFTITYRLTKPGTNYIYIDASAGSATAEATAVVRVAKAY